MERYRSSTLWISNVRWDKLREDAGKPIPTKVPTYPMYNGKIYSVVGTESVPKPTEAKTKATLEMFQFGLGVHVVI
jgi:hypothetical protein